MTREEAREAAKVMEAYANGKKIEMQVGNMWRLCFDPTFNWNKNKYRIKPEAKYRPFCTQEECWNEMHKHPDFGWIMHRTYNQICTINEVYIWLSSGVKYTFNEAFTNYKFTDGAPFGIKEE